MIPDHAFVVDDTVVEFFGERTKRERDDLLRIFKSLAESPYQRGEWLQKTISGRDLQVKRFRRWLVSYWLDAPSLGNPHRGREENHALSRTGTAKTLRNLPSSPSPAVPP